MADQPLYSDASLRPWDPRLQKQRGDYLMSLVRKAARGFFNEAGECLVSDQVQFDGNHKRLPTSPFYLRERVNCVTALMAGDDQEVAFGNLILSCLALDPCDDFSTMNLIEILLRHPEKVSAGNKQRLLDTVAREARLVQRDFNFFVGANDNFPAMGCFIMVVGGELVGDDQAVQAGLDNLYSARDLLARRGFFSEYNSPTYAGVTLHGLDETANNARRPEARELARQASERMWLEVACHWHPAMSFQAGPYSRAYHNNSIAWSSLTNILMWVAFGDIVFLNPVRTLFEEAAESYEARAGNLPFCQAGCGGYAGTIHHIPDYVGELVLSKTFPYRVRGTVEAGTFHVGDYRRTPQGACIHVPGRCADYGANSAFINTYMKADFALGTATRGFCGGGQTDLFHIIYKLRPQPQRWADLRAVFTRYQANDPRPEDSESKGLIVQYGNGFAIQDDRRALVLFHPSGYLRENIRSLKLSLIAQEMTSRIEEIWIGDRLLPAGDGESQEPDWVILRDGLLLLAFYPLPTSNLGRPAAIRSEQQDGYRVISFYNYQGPPRDFEPHEIQIIQNGFVFEAATLDDYPDAPAFLADLRQAQISDTTVLEARRVRYLRAGRELFLWMDPARQTIKSAVVNGREVAYAPLEVDGVDSARVPWNNPPGLLHENLDWWQRIAARPGLPGLEGVSGRRVE